MIQNEHGARGLRRRDVVLLIVATVLAQAWILDLPFQLDDFAVVADPMALFGHVDVYSDLDIPPFMMRVPMWLAWAFVHLFATEPLSPVLFHVFGLALHVTTAWLLARVIARHGPQALGSRAGLLAGLAFGAAAGAMQSVSWTAAWSSLLYTLFGLAGLNLALDARERGAWRGVLLAGLCFYLAIITKAPAVVVPAAALAVLAGSALPARAWRRLGGEALITGGAVGLGLLTRSIYLGTRHLRYEARVTPSLSELPEFIGKGFVGLGQALYPWNRDPLFNGEEPLFATLGWHPAWIACAFFATVVLAAAVVYPRARGPMALALVALVPAVLPPGVLYEGAETNVLSRTAYLPLAGFAGLLGLGLAGLFAWRRSAGVALSIVVGLVTMDGNRHVAWTERLNGEELRSIRALLDDIAEEARPGRTPLVLVLAPDGGFAGIPSLGGMITKCYRPPFLADEPLEIVAFTFTQNLRDHVVDAELGRRDVVVIGPECDANWTPAGPSDELSGEENRARRLPRRLSPLSLGMAADAAPVFRRDGDGWSVAEAVPAHALEVLEFELAPNEALLGKLRVPTRTGFLDVPLDLPAGSGSRIAVELPRDLAVRFGAPVTRIEWAGAEPAPDIELRVVPRVPTLEALLPIEGAAFVTADHGVFGPEFRVAALDDSWRAPSFARLELRFEFKHLVASVYNDFPLAPDVLTTTPGALHLEGAATELIPDSATAPWSAVMEQRIIPPLRDGELNQATFLWRVSLHHAGGAVAARSPFRTGRFVAED